MRQKKYRNFACDFETTVYDSQTFTEVWASASVELYTEDVQVFHSIKEQFNYFLSLDCNVRAYYHNLKFDGSFWLPFLMQELKMEQAYIKIGNTDRVKWLKEKDMANNTFKYSISSLGMWYTIIIKTKGHFIEIRDSLKLLPFSVAELGKSFKTKYKKLDMEYKGFRYAGCEITDKEKEYIANDVLVVKEALEFMFNENHDKLTIGSCCMSEYKKIVGKEDWELFFPDLYKLYFNNKLHDQDNVGEWIRKSYKGGWCYLVKGKENKIFKNGTTADVNSLYPSMMSSESGNRYPVGLPKFWTGNFIPKEALEENKYYFVRIKTHFYIKKGYLPFIQIKGSWLYNGNECLETSDIYDKASNSYSPFYKDVDGNIHDTRVELTLTMTDYILFREHYHVVDFEILDGCYFFSEIGLFDKYIEKYKKLKLESTGGMRTLSKLFLNNLYGKMASSEDSSFKIAYIKEDGSIGYQRVEEHEKQAGYIPCGSAITSYARNFTIRAAQKNFYGKDKKGFIYADTDSIHCDIEPNEFKGIKVHDKNFCCWKLETSWDTAIFARQKTYIEHVIAEDLKPIEKQYNNIKCAGMPKKCKDLLNSSMIGDAVYSDEYTEEEKEFLFDENKNPIIRTYEDFKVGLKVPSKLRPKRIRGGVVLVDTYYEMR